MNKIQHVISQFALLILVAAPGVQAQSVFVNELIYDGTTLNKGHFEESIEGLVEIAGPAGTDLNNWTIVLYDGDNTRAAVPYYSRKITGVITDQESGIGMLAFRFPAKTFQRGPHDGLALVDASGKVIQLLSYEGTFLASKGPAKGMESDPIRPSHGSTNGKQSLQLQGRGREYKDFEWSALFDSTPGEVNNKFINNKQMFLKAQ